MMISKIFQTLSGPLTFLKYLTWTAIFWVLIGGAIFIKYENQKLDEAQKENQNLKKEVKNYKEEIGRLKQDINQLKISIQKRKEIAKYNKQIRKKVDHEITQKEESKYEYEILAAHKSTYQDSNPSTSNSCGCYYDGTGWVFK